MRRRRVIGLGLAGISALAAGGLLWRAEQRGVFAGTSGSAYEPWRSFTPQGPLSGAEATVVAVRAATLAASPHNTQPWRFSIHPYLVEVHVDLARHLGAMDPFRREMFFGMGCALENMAQGALGGGLQATIQTGSGRLTRAMPTTGTVPLGVVALDTTTEPAPLFAQIARRHTDRSAYRPNQAVTAEQRQKLAAVFDGQDDAKLLFIDGGDQRARFDRLTIDATAAIIADAEMSRDSAAWFRMTPDDIDQHRDGPTLDAAGLSPLIDAVAKMLPTPSTATMDRQWLDITTDQHLATAPLVGVIAVRDRFDIAATLAAGRLWQRLHLQATALGISLQPLNQMIEIADRELQLGSAGPFERRLAELAGDAQRQITFAFRAGFGTQPPLPSPRRPLEAMLLNA